MKKKITIDEERLTKIRNFLVDNIMRESDVVFSDVNFEYDVVDIIANLYEYLHQMVTGEEYDYMWHWCNKCGGYCNTYLMDDKIEEEYNEKKQSEMESKINSRDSTADNIESKNEGAQPGAEEVE